MKKITILALITGLLLASCGGAVESETATSNEPNDVVITTEETPKNEAPKEDTPKTIGLEVKATAKKEPVAQTVQEFNVTSGYLFFKPSTIKAKVNKPVKITFTNTGMHDFTIDELGVKVDLKGTRGVASFTPTKTGTFTYYCSVAGHKEGGMVGTLVVE